MSGLATKIRIMQLRRGLLVRYGFVAGGGCAHTTNTFFQERQKFRTIESYQPERGVAQPNPPWEGC